MSSPVIIIGSGGHAKVLIDTLIKQNIAILGITETNDNLLNNSILGIPIIGDDEVITNYSPQKIALVNGIGSTISTKKRAEIYSTFKKLGYRFASVIHPSVIIGEDVKLAEGVQLMAGVIIQSGSIIGENTIVNTKASIDHDCIIGSHVHIAPGVTISGNVRIGGNTHIGTGATIIQGLQVGNDSLVAAGAVVVNNIPNNVKAIGVPARISNKSN